MLISLLYVSLLCMGVGAKASTPINLSKKEITCEKQKANNNEHQFQQILGYNGASTSEITNYQGDSPAFQPTGNTGPWHYNSSVIKTFLYYNAPYTIQGATQENRIVNGYGTIPSGSPRPVVTRYDLSTLNFYDAYMLTATAIRIDAENPTTNASITINHTPYIKYYNYSDHTITKQINIEQYAYIGYDEGHAHVFDLIYNQQNKLQEAFDYCNNTPATFSTIYNGQTQNINFISQTYNVISPNLNNTYDIGIYANKLNYIIVFTAFRVINASPFEFTDNYINLTYGSTNPPEAVMTQEEMETNLVYQLEIDNPTRFNATYSIATVNQEIVNIPGMMWEILSMPFAFISQAFNLTIFPGTPYSINFSNLFLSIFGVLVFIFIFKLILKR